MVREAELDGQRLAGMIDGILGDLSIRQGMAKAARSLAVPDAARRVAEVIEDSCREGGGGRDAREAKQA
jgi:UDP-N-acetylglucosamine:LPS N-acetylglucosamine transferase